MAPLERFRYHVVDDEQAPEDAAARPSATFRSAVPEDIAGVAATSFNSDEAAARFYLDALLETDERSPMRGVLAPERTEKVPDLQHIRTQDSGLTNTRIVHFAQTHESVPIFGARAVVELTPDRDLVSVDSRFGEVRRDISSAPRLSIADAVESVGKFTGAELGSEDVGASELTWFQSEDENWHLAWLLHAVPVEPPEAEPSEQVSSSHFPGPSPRDESVVDYLVDAHDGAVLFYYSAAPTLDVPTKCRGVGEDGVGHEFWGRLQGESYEMVDPLRHTKTYDLGFADLRTAPLPTSPIASAASDWGTRHRAAVSAHVNAMRVHDFYKSLLQRDGIDDAGMSLESIVNCTYAPAPGSQVWVNAVWSNRRMWYGQVPDDGGVLVSLSRHLDVIAHELTHGVIESSSNLVYRNEPGALNESFADTFGIIIRNWYMASDRSDVSTWSWELGAGLGPGGRPLRDLSDPGRTGDPDHYDNRYQGTRDYGGVHTNSSIHNKAVYNLLTSVEDGGRAFTVDEAAVLLYLCMVRLTALAGFTDALEVLTDVTKTYYAGEPAVRDRKVAAITRAYAQVGIS